MSELYWRETLSLSAPAPGHIVCHPVLDPRDPTRLCFAMSGGGVHESQGGGHRFVPLIKGLDVVGGLGPATITFHDPRRGRPCPSNMHDRHQQNHYRTRPGHGQFSAAEDRCRWSTLFVSQVR